MIALVLEWQKVQSLLIFSVIIVICTKNYRVDFLHIKVSIDSIMFVQGHSTILLSVLTITSKSWKVKKSEIFKRRTKFRVQSFPKDLLFSFLEVFIFWTGKSKPMICRTCFVASSRCCVHTLAPMFVLSRICWVFWKTNQVFDSWLTPNDQHRFYIPTKLGSSSFRIISAVTVLSNIDKFNHVC